MDFFVIAGPEWVTGFRYAGVAGQPVLDRQETLAAFASAPCRTAKIVIFDQECADLIREELNDWETGGQPPLVVEIPPWKAGENPGRPLVDLIREAVGLPV